MLTLRGSGDTSADEDDDDWEDEDDDDDDDDWEDEADDNSEPEDNEEENIPTGNFDLPFVPAGLDESGTQNSLPHATDEPSFPRIGRARMNLTAFSQHYDVCRSDPPPWLPLVSLAPLLT